ncbi:MAG: sulfur oxidation c-type cytochrome SoxA [Lautropia sp.]
MHEATGRSKAGGAASAAVVALAIAGAAPAIAQPKTTEEGIEQYREMLQDGNPADLNAMKGAGLWTQPRGPKNASLEKCDIGLGPGVVKGAYAQLPRYFADVDQVMDFESRLVHCMVTLQGFDREKLVAKPFSGGGQPATDIENIVAYVTDESRGEKVALPQDHPKEKEAALRGEKMFFYRAGPYDFSCASCHSNEGQRIRLQGLPNLTKPEPAQKAFTTWPAYRVSQGALRTMQWRIYDCFRQQRFPELKYLSPASIDLITYLGVKGKGGTMDAPAIKR